MEDCSFLQMEICLVNVSQTPLFLARDSFLQRMIIHPSFPRIAAPSACCHIVVSNRILFHLHGVLVWVVGHAGHPPYSSHPSLSSGSGKKWWEEVRGSVRSGASG